MVMEMMVRMRTMRMTCLAPTPRHQEDLIIKEYSMLISHSIKKIPAGA